MHTVVMYIMNTKLHVLNRHYIIILYMGRSKETHAQEYKFDVYIVQYIIVTFALFVGL